MGNGTKLQGTLIVAQQDASRSRNMLEERKKLRLEISQYRTGTKALAWMGL